MNRELARQIADVFSKILEHMDVKLSMALLIGGMHIKKNRNNFIIGTPGKIRELVDSDVDLRELEVLILGK